MHDHTYTLPLSVQDQQCLDQHDSSKTSSPVEQEECNSEELCMPSGDNQEFVNEMLELKVTARERLDIERETCNQSCNEKWHSVRYK